MKKRSCLSYLFIFMLVFESLFGVSQIVSAEKSTLADTGEPFIDLGTPIQEAQTIDAVYGQENGANVVYTTVTGSASSGDWARFNVIDIDNQRLLNSYPLEGASNSWAHVIAPDGRVYIGGSHKMFVYSPDKQEVTDLGIPISGTSSIWSLTTDEHGNIYGGIYSESVGGRVFKIDADTYKMTDLLGEKVDNAEDYIRSIAYYDGHVYAGTGSTNGRVFKINTETKEKVRMELPGSPDDEIYKGLYNKMGFVYGMTVVGQYLFAFFNGPSTIHVYDLEKQEWREKGLSNIRGLMAVTGERDGKVYTNKKDGNMWEIDIETLDERIAMPFDGSIRNSKWLDLKNQPEFDGPVMVTISYDGKVILSDPTINKRVSMRSLVEGQAINLQTMETGPDGKVYISSYMGTKGAIYDPENNDDLSLFTIGQAEGFGSVGDTMYAGVYTGAKIYGWDTNESITDKEPPLLFSVGEQQDRPFVLSEGAGKLLIGTIPDYAEHGGALTVYDPKTSAFDVYRNIVDNQSLAGLAYKDGIVYGSTTIHGGLGSDPIANKAKLFAWDMKTKTKIREWELELEELSNTVPMITGLTVGPDGLIWGVANGFVFAFDPVTYEIVKSKNVYPAVTNYGRWRPMKQYWGLDGLLYTNVADTLTVINPETMESKKLVDNVTIYALTNENNIYFSQATRVLKKQAEKPENVRLHAPNALTVYEPKEIHVEADFYGWTVDVTDKVDFEISDPALAEIENGKIIPKKAGQVTINMSYMGTTLPTHMITIEERDLINVYLDIENADFESDLLDGEIPGWSVRVEDEHTSLGLSQEQAFSGENSISLRDATTSGYAALQSDLLEVEPGKEYTTGASVYLGEPLTNPITGNDFSSSRTMYQVRYYDEDGNELGDYLGLGAAFEHPRGEWIQGEFKFTPHEGVKYIRILLSSSIAWVSNVFYDDVYVYTEELPNIVQVEEIADILVDYGTERSDIELPSTISVTINNGDTLNVDVIWNTGEPVYESEVTGTYAFTGTLDTKINNLDELVAVVNVTVLEKEEEPTESSLDELSEQLEIYIDADEVHGPLVNQLRNSLKQAKHHLNKGSQQKAGDFVEKFLKHMNNQPMQKHIDEAAQADLSEKAGNLINQWKK